MLTIWWWFEWNEFRFSMKKASIFFRSLAEFAIFLESWSSMFLTFSLGKLSPHLPQTHGECLSFPSGNMDPLHLVQIRVSKLEPRSLGSLHRGHSQQKFQLSWINSVRSIWPAKKLVYLLKISCPFKMGVWARTQTTWSALLNTLVLTTHEWFMVARDGWRILSIPLPSPAVTAQALVLTMEMYLRTTDRRELVERMISPIHFKKNPESSGYTSSSIWTVVQIELDSHPFSILRIDIQI